MQQRVASAASSGVPGLASLLTEKEQQEIADLFEELDVNGDGVISRSEYVEHQRELEERTLGRTLKPEEVEAMMSFWISDFQVRDSGMGGGVAGDQLISWWEFLEFYSISLLKRRPAEQLVRLLTPDEIREARSYFDRHDLNHDGVVTRQEAVESAVEWMQTLQEKGFFSTMDKASAQRHLRVKVELFMEADLDHDGVVKWEEYLKHQALFLLRARADRETRLFSHSTSASAGESSSASNSSASNAGRTTHGHGVSIASGSTSSSSASTSGGQGSVLSTSPNHRY